MVEFVAAKKNSVFNEFRWQRHCGVFTVRLPHWKEGGLGVPPRHDHNWALFNVDACASCHLSNYLQHHLHHKSWWGLHCHCHNWRLFYKRVSNYDLTFGEEVLFVQQLSVFPCRLKLKFVLQQLLVGDHHSILGNQTLLHSARVPGSPLVTHSHSIIKTFKFIVLTNHQWWW